MLDAYQRAAAIYNANAKKHVLNETLQEKWIEYTSDFWFELDVLDDKAEIKTQFMRYLGDTNEIEVLFDHVLLAQKIKPYYEKAMPFDLGITAHTVFHETFYFDIKDVVGEFAYDLKEGILTHLRYPRHAKEEVPSPDLAHSAFVRCHDVYVRDNVTGEEYRLTEDGREDRDYAQQFSMVSERCLKKEPRVFPPAINWSPDATHFLTYRRDTRRSDDLHLVQSVPINGQSRPIGVQYPYSLPSDDHILTCEVYLMDVAEKTSKKVLLDGQPFELLLLSMFDSENDMLKWTKDGKEAYLVRYDRYFKRSQAVIIDVETATARVAATMSYETFGFTEYYGHAAQEGFNDSGLIYLPDSRELLWLLEKENWASVYLLDADTGEFKNDLAPGDYNARRIRYVDEVNRLLYFSASGREENVDPYYQILYCVSFDGGDVTRISRDIAEHVARFSKNGRYYIDTYSTITTKPVSEVCDVKGQTLSPLAKADLSRIMEKGYIVPEPFEALARDGETPVYGILIKPHGFDPAKKYPVIDYVYGGPQRINTPKAFEFHSFLGADPQGGLQSLAQLGFVGVIIDGLATPLRGKKIHDMTYGKPEECCGLEDHVAAIKELAGRHHWIDIDRVGIWGASGGGYATARALLQFPDFYKVGVSLCGNHDQARYHAHWGERWIGPYSEETYHDQANKNFAKNLIGRLLLIHGDMDDNVHPSATIALAASLIDENKDFDLLIYPNSAHGVGQFPYVVRRRWDYFVRHLLGRIPPSNFWVQEKEEAEESA